jgi:hypothetical protein
LKYALDFIVKAYVNQEGCLFPRPSGMEFYNLSQAKRGPLVPSQHIFSNMIISYLIRWDLAARFPTAATPKDQVSFKVSKSFQLEKHFFMP